MKPTSVKFTRSYPDGSGEYFSIALEQTTDGHYVVLTHEGIELNLDYDDLSFFFAAVEEVKKLIAKDEVFADEKG
jgi:hypothetical protein